MGAFQMSNGGESLPPYGGFRSAEKDSATNKVLDIISSKQVPVIQSESDISGDGKINQFFLYSGERYILYPMSKETTLSVPGTTEEMLTHPLIKIWDNKIWYYWPENLDKEYLLYSLVGEVLCPEIADGKLLDAMKEELSIVPYEIIHEYVSYKIQFFSNMLNYWQNLSVNDLEKMQLDEKYQEKYITELGGILEYLKQFIPNQK